MTLAEQINERRIARGKEPLRLADIERAIRFVAGKRPAVGRSPLFQAKARVIIPDVTRGGCERLRRQYTKHARGRG